MFADFCLCPADVFNDDTSKYDQTVFLNGKQVSTLSTSSGQAQGWGTAVECQAQACTGTALAHSTCDILADIFCPLQTVKAD